MRRYRVFILLGIALFIFGVAQLGAEEKATAKDVKAKCEEAAKLLAEKGEAALPEFNDNKGPWVFKDSYVFVYDMEGKIIGHPIMDLGLDVGKSGDEFLENPGHTETDPFFVVDHQNP